MGAVVIVGLGELGGLFAHGFLRLGHTLVPVLRSTNRARVAERHPEPDLVLIAVGEDDLQPTLAGLPPGWRDRVALLQNELLPRDYQGLPDPSVAVIWFEKKPKRAINELLPSQLFGPRAPLLEAALSAMNLESEPAPDPLLVLVQKNLYVLTVNIAGLETGGSVRELWTSHRALAEGVADDVVALQAALTGAELPRAELLAFLERAIFADPEHVCTGRSAPARLRRALDHADRLGLEVPELRRIAAKQESP